MSDWPSWAFNVMFTNGMVIGIGFVAVAMLRGYRENQTLAVTQIDWRTKRPPSQDQLQQQQQWPRRLVDLYYASKRDEIRTWLSASNSMCPLLIVGPRSSGRSSLVNSSLDVVTRSVIVRVDLNAMPAETVDSWIPRFAETSNSRRNWNVFQSAFQQLYELIGGRTINSSDVRGDNLDTTAPASSVVKLREALRFVEADLTTLRAASGLPLPPVLVLDGLESLAALGASSDVGRRAVVVFLGWLARLAAAGIARPLLTTDGPFYVENFVLPAKLRDVQVSRFGGSASQFTSLLGATGCDAERHADAQRGRRAAG